MVSGRHKDPKIDKAGVFGGIKSILVMVKDFRYRASRKERVPTFCPYLLDGCWWRMLLTGFQADFGKEYLLNHTNTLGILVEGGSTPFIWI